MERVFQFTRDYYRYTLLDDGCGLEACVDYRDGLGLETVRTILDSDHPSECLDDILSDGLCHYWAFESDFWAKLKIFCRENGIDLNEAEDAVYEKFYWVFPESFSNPDIPVTIQIDAGDANYDFVRHCQLNYIHDDSDIGGSGLGWLARQQRELTALRRAIREEKRGITAARSPFVESCIDELYNLSSAFGTLTFFVRMSLCDAIALKEGRADSITLPAGVEAGLVDTWQGSGSLLGLDIRRQVTIPAGMMYRVFCDDGRNGYWPVSVYHMSADRQMKYAVVA